MESNQSDKELRDKLEGLEVPFDPQAWTKMEQMLDKKKKRRFIFWWWSTGGIAALIVLGLIGYEWKEKYEVGSTKWETGKKLEVKGEKFGARKDDRNNATGEVALAEKKLEVEEKPIETDKGVNEKNQGKNRTNVLAENPITPTEKRKAHSKTSDRTSNAFNESSPRPVSKRTSALKTKQEKAIAEFKEEIKAEERTVLAAIVHESMGADKLVSPEQLDEVNMAKQNEEEIYKKKKKRLLNYSIGIRTEITTVTLGSQESSQPNVPIRTEKNHTPSYMVGLTQDLMFWKRVTLTNSLMFSQTSFKVQKPKTTAYTHAPLEYTSKITEANITIGIKGYPISKERFRFYLAAGIINHIKLKETFTYKTPPPTTTTAGGLYDSLLRFPSSTNFSSVPLEDATNSPGIPKNNQGSTSDFSINKAARYYASFYASAGTEFIFKKHFILFAEPVYFMSLQKIGVQDKRKYNFGLSAGARYQF